VTTPREQNIEIKISDALNGRKFDDRTYGLAHCMKAVDFIVELTDRILFIEIYFHTAQSELLNFPLTPALSWREMA